MLVSFFGTRGFRVNKPLAIDVSLGGYLFGFFFSTFTHTDVKSVLGAGGFFFCRPRAISVFVTACGE